MPRWRCRLGLCLGLALACSPETPIAPEVALVDLPHPIFSSVAVQNGRIAFVSSMENGFEIWAINPDGSGLSKVMANPIDGMEEWEPAWSPDGTKLAFMMGDDVWVVNADGSGRTNLTNHPGRDDMPAWSSDGARIAFHSDRDGNREIYIMNANGSGQTRLTNDPATDEQPSWSPDGTKIAFNSGSIGAGAGGGELGHETEIYVINVDGSGQTRLTHSPGLDYEPSWSPDGSKIAFTSSRDGNEEIYVMNVDGSAPTNLTNSPGLDAMPAWSPDAAKIVFWSGSRGRKMYVMNADGSGLARITIDGVTESELMPNWGAAPGATPIGSTVSVQPVDPETGTTPVQLTFGTVTAPGTTTVTSSEQGAPLPLGFRLGDPPVYYELTTTATFVGSITVCFTYDPAAYQSANVRLLHGEAGVWTDVTTSLDPGGHVICGTTTSLSPFITAELHYSFTGFFQPVDNGQVLNVAKAGSSIPVKFSLGGNLGPDILTTNSPTTGVISCNSIPTIDPIEELTTSPSGLHIGNNQYTYVWATKPEWKGTCRKFMLNLKDGTQHVALFQFK